MKSKRQRLDKNGRSKKKVEDDTPHIPFASAGNWEKEQDWEGQVRLGKRKKETTRLPVKTADGRIAFAPAGDSDESESESEEEEEEEEQEEEVEEPVDTTPQEPSPIRIRKAKEEMAKMATLLNEDPEEHVGTLSGIERLKC